MMRSMNARPLVFERITITYTRSNKIARPAIPMTEMTIIIGPPSRYHSSVVPISWRSGWRGRSGPDQLESMKRPARCGVQDVCLVQLAMITRHEEGDPGL